MVSTYPPKRCGIGAYAEQSVAQLRAQGHVVDIVSPDLQGNVDFAWDLHGGKKLLQLFRILPYYDRVVLQYHWAFFYRNPFLRERRWETLQTTLCFVLLFLRCRKLEVVAHEIPYIPGKQGWLYQWKWKFAPRIVFHTTRECERFEQHYGMQLNRSRITFRGHDDVYQKFVRPHPTQRTPATQTPAAGIAVLVYWLHSAPQGISSRDSRLRRSRRAAGRAIHRRLAAGA